MKLIGKKIILKPAEAKNVPVFFKWVHDSETMKYMNGLPPPKTLAGEYKWFNKLKKNKKGKGCYKKCGFIQEGYLKHDTLVRDKWRDSILMAVIR